MHPKNRKNLQGSLFHDALVTVIGYRSRECIATTEAARGV
jgi:hypothetical protein